MATGVPGFFDMDERLAELSSKGDDLERVNAVVDFEVFRTSLEAAVPRAERSKGVVCTPIYRTPSGLS
jgi:transposase, IS5 family